MAKLDCIVTSVKPFCGDAYSEHQKNCIIAMTKVADSVKVFNRPDELAGFNHPDVEYMESDTRPPLIFDMIRFGRVCSQGGVFALVNGDILLDDGIVGCVNVGRRIGRTWAATSFRWEYDTDIKDAKVEGQGLDVFVMTGPVAYAILHDIPRFLTIGRPLWDNWVNGWLRLHLPSHRYFDMTHWKCVFHPHHERTPNRLENYTQEQVAQLSKNVGAGGMTKTKYNK